MAAELPQIMHPLKHKWSWSFKPTIVYKIQTAEAWMSDYRNVVPRTFETVEEFYGIFQHLPSLPQLDLGNIYAVFREGIQPTWEHPRNEHGYSIIFYPNKNLTDEEIIKLNKLALLLLIGEGGPFSGAMTGCTLERKTAGNKIVFWMGTSPSGGQAEQIATVKQVLQLLGIPQSDTTLVDNVSRIDWKDPRFSAFKIAIRCVSHKKRANEPPPQRSDSRHNNSQASSQRSRNSNSKQQRGGDVGGGGGGGGGGGVNRSHHFQQSTNPEQQSAGRGRLGKKSGFRPRNN